MTTDDRSLAMARMASGLAAGAGIELPAELRLWTLVGGRPSVAPVPTTDPARDLGTALEARLTTAQRRRGAHFTPTALADGTAARALADRDAGGRPVVVDPACGAGALLISAGRCLVAAGVPIAVVARDLLWGADLDPLAVAVTEAAIALWSGGTAPGPSHLVVGDTLLAGAGAWPAPPPRGFDVLVGNPPFQGQLSQGTARSRLEAAALRARFGSAAAAYVDTAALFLLAGSQLVAPGGRLAMVLPQSVAAARDARPVRDALAAAATLRELWVPPDRPFGARVDVCVPVFEVGPADGRAEWADRLAGARGVPAVALAAAGTVGDRAGAVVAFRQEYYGLAGHVREARETSLAPLVTSGLIDVGAMAWGARPARFAKRSWARPEVDVEAVRAGSARVSGWLDRVLHPKVVVASQTRVIEAAADHGGRWVPSTPAIGIVPHDPDDVAHLASALCAPPVSAWAVRRAAGTALSPDAIRVSGALLLEVPLPVDVGAWAEATALLAAGDLDGFAPVASRMYGLSVDAAEAVCRWWTARRPG